MYKVPMYRLSGPLSSTAEVVSENEGGIRLEKKKKKKEMRFHTLGFCNLYFCIIVILYNFSYFLL